tara:strand:- start:29 stop:397 length:369 start_codon:yes stop_codon:yes gene_type:complete
MGAPKTREEALKRMEKDAYAEGARIYNEGWSGITSYMNKQGTKDWLYNPEEKAAIDRGYNDAKTTDKTTKELDKRVKESGNKKIKKASGGAVKRYKKGGKIKKCRMDGIAIRGKTRAKQRSK